MQGMVIEHRNGAEGLPSRSFLDRISDLAFILSRNGRQLLFLNESAQKRLGWLPSDIDAWNAWTEHYLDVSSREKIWELASADEHHQDRPPIELVARSGLGSEVRLQVHTAIFEDESLLTLANWDSDTNVTLRQMEARFRSVVDSLSVRLVLKDRQGRRIFANQAYLDDRGLKLSDFLGKTDEQLFPADIAQRFRQDDLQVMKTGRLIHKYEETTSKNGKRRWTEIIKGPLLDADKNITGVQILLWDATNRRKTELAFERERNLLHALLDNIPDSIYFKDQESRFVRISRGMAEKFHMNDAGDVIGKTDADIFSEEHARQARLDELDIMHTGKPMIARVERETWPNTPDTWCSTTKMPLRDSEGRIVGTFGISRDITDLIEAREQLIEARDAADRANAAKSDFLANMSHEIRTPMNGIIGMTELLSNTSLEDDQRSFVDMVEQSAQALLRIINDILDFSKIEAGKLELESIAFDLRKCLKQMARSLAIRAAQKSLELVLEIASDVPQRVTGDPDRLRQVLVNLVGNAIKFTSTGEIRILVEVQQNEQTGSLSQIHFAVKDTGIGIPQDKCQSIFEAFSQADRSTTRQFGGTGLGLSISSQIVEMMNGRIWLESTPGHGSTFHFTAQFADAQPTPRSTESHQDWIECPFAIVSADRIGMQNLTTDLSKRQIPAQVFSEISSARAWLNSQSPQEADGSNQNQTRLVLLIDPASPHEQLGDSPFVQELAKLRDEWKNMNPVTILATSLTEQLPRSELHAYGFDAVVQRPVFFEEIAQAVKRAGQGSHKRRRRRRESRKPRSGCKFLLAEDGQVNRAVFVGLLQDDGHEVISVENGEQAVEAWRTDEFDAILMDVQMPLMDGLEATRSIRREELKSKQHIPIIALTAGAMDSDRHQCEDAGMDYFVSKPVDSEHFRSIIEKVRSIASEDEANGDSKSNESGFRESEMAWNVSAPLKQFDYSPEQLRTLATTMRAELVQRTTEIAQALQDDDLPLLTRAAHTLKSAAGLFEARSLQSLAQAIEDFARAREPDEIPALAEELQQAAEEVRQQIDSWLESET